MEAGKVGARLHWRSFAAKVIMDSSWELVGTSACYLSKQRYSFHSIQELVIRLVRTDPEPVEFVALSQCNGSVRTANVGGPNFTLLLQAKRRMERIVGEKIELFIGQLADVFRQFLAGFPEVR